MTQYGAPGLSCFALLTFVAATLIQSFVNVNHRRTVTAQDGNGIVVADEVCNLQMRMLPFLGHHDR